MIRISDILDKIAENNPEADLDIIDRAYIYSARVHQGQTRLSGEPYLSHPLEVAAIVADLKLDVESVTAALLHDVIEDTRATREDIENMFGPRVAHIVSGVTKLSKLTFSTKAAHQAESLRKMILAMADDLRVILIKLTDRLHNMRTLKYHTNPEKQRLIAQETLDIYVPIAGRLGIYWIKQELEDIAFSYTLPEQKAEIDRLVNRAKKDKENYIALVKERLSKKLEEAGIECEIKGRYKQPYSIYHKMISQDLEFHEIYDIIAFRLILDTVPKCYEALGIIHSMWRPIYNKIKDYIGNPKPNMYQSLHTTVIGPYGERVEIQIRTWDMDRTAEAGIAAHWSYKENTSVDNKTGKLFEWIKNLVENQENFKDPDEFLENVRIDLYPDEIYVFTPHGEIRTLPKDATPIDFAYLIHTEIGHTCKGAKVNGALVPLTYKLQTGDTVEIITAKQEAPSADWLHIIKTVKAKTKIRQWLNAREKERSLSLGREMCEKEFRKKNYNFHTLSKSGDIKKVAQGYGFTREDDLIAQVGFGKITPRQILHRAVPELEQEPPHEKPFFKKIIEGKRRKKDTDGVVVKGLDDILVKFSKCCNPLPGDPIIGFITQGEGVKVHRKNCINTHKMNPERQIEVEWSRETTETYPASIKVTCDDRSGLLADLAYVISKNNSNIRNVHSDTTDTGTSRFYFTISVESSDQLHRIMSHLKKVKKVKNVKRIVGNRDGEPED